MGVKRARGMDWVYTKKVSVALKQDGLTPSTDLVLFDLVGPGEVDAMTTATVLRTIIRLSFFTSANWDEGNVDWYIAVVRDAWLETVYNSVADPVVYQTLFPTVNVLEQVDPIYWMTTRLPSGAFSWGDPSDNPVRTFLDVTAKRSLADGDKLALIIAPEPQGVVGGTVTYFVDTSVLVRAA